MLADKTDIVLKIQLVFAVAAGIEFHQLIIIVGAGMRF